MNILSNKRILFVAKSLLWSALLYAVCMLLFAGWHKTTTVLVSPQKPSIPWVHTLEQVPVPVQVNVKAFFPFSLF